DLVRRPSERADDGSADELDPAEQAVPEVLRAVVKTGTHSVRAGTTPLRRGGGALGSAPPPLEGRQEHERRNRRYGQETARGSHALTPPWVIRASLAAARRMPRSLHRPVRDRGQETATFSDRRRPRTGPTARHACDA